MILTTIPAYIFSFRPSTHWSIAIQATCEPGREALIRATHNPVNCRHIDVLKQTLLSILLEPIHPLRWCCKNWLPIMRQLDKLQCGHCKTWKASFLVFSANCEQVIGYFNTDHSSNMPELQAPTNKLNLTLKQASKRLDLKRPHQLFRSWWSRFKKCPLLEFISQEPNLALEWQAALTKPLVIVVRAPYKKKAKLIFDGRLWHQGSEDPVCWIILSVTGKLVGKKNNISQLPRQNLGRKF